MTAAVAKPEAPRRPLLRYHGGKFRIREWIIAHFPPHRIYTETFGGAGSILLAKPRAMAEIYNDLNSEVVNVFRVMRDPGRCRRLRRLLKLTPFSRAEFAASYDLSDDPIEQARRTIVKGFFGFGSESIFRDKGFGKHIKVPYAPTGFRSRPSTRAPTGFRHSVQSTTTPATEWAAYSESLAAFLERLSGVVIENRPATQILAAYDRPDALHYLDPPYVLGTRTGSKIRYSHELSDWDHELLLAQLNNLEGMVVLSGYESEIYNAGLAGWTRYQRRARAAGGGARVEILWLNPHAQSALETYGITPPAPGVLLEPSARAQHDLFTERKP